MGNGLRKTKKGGHGNHGCGKAKEMMGSKTKAGGYR